MSLPTFGWGSTLLWHMGEVTVVILAIGGAALLIGRKRPHVAHALWIVVIVKCLLPPGTTSPFGLLPAPLAFPDATPAAVLLPVEGSPSSHPDVEVVDSSYQNSSVSVAPSVSTRADQVASPAPSFGDSYGLASLCLSCWIGGVLYFVASTMTRWLRASRVLRAPADEPPTYAGLQASVQRLCHQLDCHRPVQALIHSDNYGPLVMGWAQPKIILPQAVLERCSPQELDLILAHEIVHLRRGDIVWSLLQWISQVVWWFHPLVWWANRQLDRVCEVCCDEEVVASLNCNPRDYARCLLQIAELRHHLRDMPAVPASRPSHITKARLHYLLGHPQRFAPRVPRWVVASAIVLGATLMPSNRHSMWAQSSNHETDATLTVEMARAAFAGQRWPEAILAYRQLVDQHADNAEYWLRLGFALHANGQWEEAIATHQRASTFPATRPVALYNLACAYCLQGRQTEALDTLATAIDAGFRSPQPLKEDADFASLRDDERFQRLSEQANRSRMPEVYRQLDFWVGTWTVLNARGEAIGNAFVTKDEAGHLITEKWRSFGRDTGTGISFFDPSSKTWKQTWVDSSGSVSSFAGSMQDGVMLFTGETVFATGRKVLSSSSLQPTEPDRVTLVMKHSPDNGTTWNEVFRGTYVRRQED